MAIQMPEPLTRIQIPTQTRTQTQTDKATTTYSMWSTFRDCRKKCYWRYQEELVPIQTDSKLTFGTLIHKCLEAHHNGGSRSAILDIIETATAGRTTDNAQGDDKQRQHWHVARAMMLEYSGRWESEDSHLQIYALEKTFSGPIINPATGATSRTFNLSGRVDGIVEYKGNFYLIEHKTAATLDADYLEKLWTDFQICLYSYYIEQVFGIRISGVLYNILVKAQLKQSKGETEQEYEERYALLCAANKSGKSSATRKMPETDDDFQERLIERYRSDPMMLHRELLYLDRGRFTILQSELWELTQALLDCRRRDTWYQNTNQCFGHYGKCPYLALCTSNGSEIVKGNLYEHKPAHSELADDIDNDTNGNGVECAEEVF